MQTNSAHASETRRSSNAAKATLRVFLILLCYVVPALSLTIGAFIYFVMVSPLGRLGISDSVLFMPNTVFERIGDPGPWREARWEDAQYSLGRHLPLERLQARDGKLSHWWWLYRVRLVQVRDLHAEHEPQIGYCEFSRNWLMIVAFPLLAITIVIFWIRGLRWLLRSSFCEPNVRVPEAAAPPHAPQGST